MKNVTNPKISVILPFRNAQKTLKACLESLIFQTYENLEILCIDYGSCDNSSKIIQKYKDTDKRIRLLNLEEASAGAAKNLGVSAATGDYVSFIYPQDKAFLNLYERFVQVSPQNPDLFIFNAQVKGEDRSIYKKRFFTIRLWDNHLNENSAHTILDCKNPFFGLLTSVNKIYSLRFLKKNNISFASDLIFEDYLFHIDTLIRAENILVCEDILYKHKETDREIIKKSENVSDIFEIIGRMEKSLTERNLSERFKYLFLEYKYMQADYVFRGLKFSQRSKFFAQMQEYFKKIDINAFDPAVCCRLAEFEKFNNIRNLDWANYSLGKRF